MNKSDGINILVVDDEADLLELCKDAFEMEGHHVTACISGIEALSALEESSFDVIISDAKMPNMSGEQFFEQAKSLMATNLPPFFLATGAIDLNEKELIEGGVTGIIMKPYDVDDMINEVVATVKNSQS